MKHKNILVAVDGSQESENAFQQALEIAKANDANLHVVHVVDVDRLSAGAVYTPYTKTTGALLDVAKELLQKYSAKAKSFGIKDVNIILEQGSPKRDIPLKISDENNIDLIVCGATGVNAIERFLIGSVSEQIVRLSKCDVLVVRDRGDNSNS